ncbi:Glycosyl hydrolase family 63 C-terminal domain-containing protein [Hymenobacter gelipurpurascens]|uniref:Glycosyl hydrolase family 63 C-terminal domain-containing protein n=1 Tax=Hymenobacter gelipurpurascens TaxID=89968 RepID=A0A212T4V8_9BACT|nr:glucosidase [Hymenobacter gelipurpurascens]SNC61045.1 Glycosyl hydrolase family 63 C-terminal domain-containing protein [Hymenobacter gelipurpurascens]
MTQEQLRLAESAAPTTPWKKFGPYLTERQWGTVREDYSPEGNAWEYITHDMARSKAYRWGEEGLGGICDDQQLLCFAVGLWNGQDEILKERLFGLTNGQGNHGEDVKELYYYLDSTPTHSYMRMLYKYPQRAFPYRKLVRENGRRNRQEPEYELLDTGIFSKSRYFDVFIEYAKAGPDDILIKVTVHNRGPKAAPVQVLPQLWYRNTWSWGHDDTKPVLRETAPGTVQADHATLGHYHFYCEQAPPLLFCENDTNGARLYNLPAKGLHFKDGINDYVVEGDKQAINARQEGTKMAAHYQFTLQPNESRTVRLRLSKAEIGAAFSDFDQVFQARQQEADEFYECIQENLPDPDVRNVQRQAFAGMLWSKQYYYYDVNQWLEGDPAVLTPPPERRKGRNHHWRHLHNADIISMPDKWEYPWYAAWDLAFHCIPLAMVDAGFAKHQLRLLTRDWYMHPNGQLPAYEWNFSDVNPPVHAWATWRVYQMDKKLQNGQGDTTFLEAVFHKLALNFAWWVNRKDKSERNIFEGGFLGLDNIGVFDRSSALPTGGFIEQSDGTSWMAMFALNMMRMALELAKTNPVYQDMASKFFEHFLYIADAMTRGGDGLFNLWDEEDGFYYDVLHTPDEERTKLKVRSIVGLIPLFAVEVIEQDLLDTMPEFTARARWLIDNRPHLAQLVSRWEEPGKGARHLLGLLRRSRLKKLLTRMLDESEFLSDYGIRAMSRHHLEHPYVFSTEDDDFVVQYVPGEAESSMFGGNSNWRGPIWFPINFLIIESLQRYYFYYGENFTVEYPTGSGTLLNLNQVATALAGRLTKLLLKDENGRRPAFGDNEMLQTDPHFRDNLLFHEYFHGDNGNGLGANHQTGWTGLIVRLLQLRG